MPLGSRKVKVYLSSKRTRASVRMSSSSFFLNFLGKNRILNLGSDLRDIRDLKKKINQLEGVPCSELRILKDEKLRGDDDLIVGDATYRTTMLLRGGKGGFGSMLRMLGAQIEKTTNREACRDLSGRRMRDVNNEQKLAEWVQKKADKEREEEERKRERLEKRRAEPKHYFSDPKYEKEKQAILENVDDAIMQGLAAATASTSSSLPVHGKRKIQENISSSSKKKRLWLGFDDSDLDSSSDEGESNSSDEGGESNSSENSKNDSEKNENSDSDCSQNTKGNSKTNATNDKRESIASGNEKDKSEKTARKDDD